MATKSTAQIRFEQAYYKEQLDKYPHRSIEWFERYFPYVKPKKTKANLLTSMIIDWINWNGWQAERITSSGRVIGSKRIVKTGLFHANIVDNTKYIKPTSKNGTADISATIKGRSVKIEVKIGNDRQSTDQKNYQKDVEKAKGIYFIAKDFEGFMEFWDSIINEN